MRRTDFFEKLKKDKRVIILVGIGILGMLLLLFSETGTTAKKDSGEALPYGEKAEKELGWKAERSIDDTMRSAWAWQKHLDGC